MRGYRYRYRYVCGNPYTGKSLETGNPDMFSIPGVLSLLTKELRKGTKKRTEESNLLTPF